MGSKGKLLLVMALFLLPALRLSAQENHSADPRFVQRLSWYADENAIRYEVVIEELPDSREVLRQTTEEDFVEFSLPAGNYRYRIRAWDFFEKPTAYSPWSPLEILQALRPELFEVFVEDSALSLKGRNLISGALVQLKNRGRVTGEFQILPPSDPAPADGAVLPLPSPLKPGNYELTLENPGGFSTTISFRVDRVKAPGPVFQVSAAYSPLIPLYGEFNELLDTPFYPAGAALRLEFFPLRFGEGAEGFSLGLGLSPAWQMLSTSYVMGGTEFELSGHLLGAQGFILGQIRLSGSMTVNLRAGGGVFLLKNLNKHYTGKSYDTIDVLLPAGSGGISFLWAFREPFFAEAGLEFTHFFSVDNPAPGYLRPFLGLGLRF
jgi:hypothetical protein